jgi:hypothetical protein
MFRDKSLVGESNLGVTNIPMKFRIMVWDNVPTSLTNISRGLGIVITWTTMNTGKQINNNIRNQQERVALTKDLEGNWKVTAGSAHLVIQLQGHESSCLILDGKESIQFTDGLMLMEGSVLTLEKLELLCGKAADLCPPNGRVISPASNATFLGYFCGWGIKKAKRILESEYSF